MDEQKHTQVEIAADIDDIMGRIRRFIEGGETIEDIAILRNNFIRLVGGIEFEPGVGPVVVGKDEPVDLCSRSIMVWLAQDKGSSRLNDVSIPLSRLDEIRAYLFQQFARQV